VAQVSSPVETPGPLSQRLFATISICRTKLALQRAMAGEKNFGGKSKNIDIQQKNTIMRIRGGKSR